MKQYRRLIKLELDFYVNELKNLKKLKKINDSLQNYKKESKFGKIH